MAFIGTLLRTRHFCPRRTSRCSARIVRSDCCSRTAGATKKTRFLAGGPLPLDPPPPRSGGGYPEEARREMNFVCRYFLDAIFVIGFGIRLVPPVSPWPVHKRRGRANMPLDSFLSLSRLSRSSVVFHRMIADREDALRRNVQPKLQPRCILTAFNSLFGGSSAPYLLVMYVISCACVERETGIEPATSSLGIGKDLLPLLMLLDLRVALLCKTQQRRLAGAHPILC
jgi:hypothetical protein